MKKFLIILLICIFVESAFAVEFDDSIDSDIRKNYDVDELPKLPKVKPNKTEMPKEVHKFEGKTYTIKSGTKIILISKNKISNWNSVGSKFTLISQNPVTTLEGAVIPAGTLFKGTITNSHPPQITGNGGLIKLKINEIYYNGIFSAINTKLTIIDSKKIYTGKIKGKRKYLQNCARATNFGKKTFNVMKKASKALLPYPIINILSIVPFTIGSVTFLTNAMMSPVISIFMKGGSVSIPANTAFYVQMSGNNQIRG